MTTQKKALIGLCTRCFTMKPLVTTQKYLDESYNAGYEKGKKETEKAFGGCTKCYGKGYSTYRYGYSAAADFEGETEVVNAMKTHMIPCSCDRGKQLKELLKDTDKLGIGIT